MTKNKIKKKFSFKIFDGDTQPLSYEQILRHSPELRNYLCIPYPHFLCRCPAVVLEDIHPGTGSSAGSILFESLRSAFRWRKLFPDSGNGENMKF